MTTLTHRFKCIVTAFALTFAFTTPAFAQKTGYDDLFQELIEADEATHERIADRLLAEFAKSGSPSMDLLLRRGQDAAEDGEMRVAIEHFTAVIDHAPDFAEAYHSRASAYFSIGLVGPAIDDVRQTLVLNPQHFEAMFGVGIMLEELDRKNDAVAAYEAILAIYPLNPDALAALDRLSVELEGQAI